MEGEGADGEVKKGLKQKDQNALRKTAFDVQFDSVRNHIVFSVKLH